MLIEALQNLLAADSGLQSILGASTRSDGNGVFPTQAPDQCTMPYVVLRQVGGESLQESLRGTGCLTTERWRFTCCGTTYKSAKRLAKYVRGFLLSTDGPINGSQTVGKCFIQGCWVKMECDDRESLGKGTMFSTHLDFDINYQDFDTGS
jgi:hypothetical protein